MTPLNIGLIGCGTIAVSAHIPALQRLSALVRLRRVCDIRQEAAEWVGQALGCAWTTDARVVVDDPEIDAVLITTPEFLHAEQTIAAVSAGKHVLCEKPMARTLPEADAMLAAAEAAGVHFMVAHSRRFTARYLRARELLDGGAIGRPIFVRENERRSRIAPARLNTPVPGWRPDPKRPTTWHAQAEYSAGTALHIGVHEMDLYRWFAGSEARSVYMETRITAADMEVPDTAAIQITFASGALAAGEIVTQAPVGYPSAHEFEIFGTEGMLRSRDVDSYALRHLDASGMHFPTAAESLLLVHDAYFVEQRLFFESVVDDTPVPLDPRESRAALALALAAIESSSTGQRVHLPLAVGV